MEYPSSCVRGQGNNTAAVSAGAPWTLIPDQVYLIVESPRPMSGDVHKLHPAACTCPITTILDLYTGHVYYL